MLSAGQVKTIENLPPPISHPGGEDQALPPAPVAESGASRDIYATAEQTAREAYELIQKGEFGRSDLLAHWSGSFLDEVTNPSNTANLLSCEPCLNSVFKIRLFLVRVYYAKACASPDQNRRAQLFQESLSFLKANEEMARSEKTPIPKQLRSELYQIHGDILMVEGQLAESAEHYRQAIVNDDDNTDAKLALANVLSWQGLIDEGIAKYNLVLKKVTPHSSLYYEALLGIADCNNWQGNFRLAGENYRRVLDGLLNAALEVNTEPYRMRAEFGFAESLLRTAGYQRINEIEEFLKYVMDRVKPNSPLYFRARLLILEAAGVCFSAGDDASGYRHLKQIEGDSSLDDSFRMRAKLVLARNLRCRGLTDKASATAQGALHYFDAIGFGGAEGRPPDQMRRPDPKFLQRQPIDLLELYAEAMALLGNSYVTDAVHAVYRVIIEKSKKLGALQRLKVLQKYAALCANSLQPPDFKQAEKLFLEIIEYFTRGSGNRPSPLISEAERFALADAYAGLAEIYSWAEHQDLEKGIHYYQLAVGVLQREEPDEGTSHMLGKIFSNLSGIYETLGNTQAAGEAIRKANHFIPHDGSDSDNRVQASENILTPFYLDLSYRRFTGSGGMKGDQISVVGNIPLFPHLEASLRQNVVSSDGALTSAGIYLGGRINSIPLSGSSFVNMEGIFRLNSLSQDGPSFRYFRQPSAQFNLSLFSAPATANITSFHDFYDTGFNLHRPLRLSGLFTSARLRLSNFTDHWFWSGINIGPDYGWSKFLTSGGYNEKHLLAPLALQGTWKLADPFRINAGIRYPLIEWAQSYPTGDPENFTAVVTPSRADMSLLASLNLGYWGVPLTLSASTQHSKQHGYFDPAGNSIPYASTEYSLMAHLNAAHLDLIRHYFSGEE